MSQSVPLYLVPAKLSIWLVHLEEQWHLLGLRSFCNDALEVLEDLEELLCRNCQAGATESEAVRAG